MSSDWIWSWFIALQVFFLSCVAIVSGMEFADFGTGVYHFSAARRCQVIWRQGVCWKCVVDNYGSAKTPIVGSQIEAFQGVSAANNLTLLWLWKRSFYQLIGNILIYLISSIQRIQHNSSIFVAVCVMCKWQFLSPGHHEEPWIITEISALPPEPLGVFRGRQGNSSKLSNNYKMITTWWQNAWGTKIFGCC